MGYATFALNRSSFPQLFHFFHVLLCGKETVIKILSDRLMVRWCSFGNAVFIGYSERHKCLTFPTSSPSWPNSHLYGSLCFTLSGEKERVSIISQCFMLCTRMSDPAYLFFRILLSHRCGTPTKLNAASKSVEDPDSYPAGWVWGHGPVYITQRS